ncbi:MAG: hypothetical protein QOI47_861 [Actinomycetota bacterium]|nr:hypothetical protein [Actinomycetota bacterium]
MVAGDDGSRRETVVPDISDGTPALICSTCRAETALLMIDLRHDPTPACPACGTPFRGFSEVPRRRVTRDDLPGTLMALIETLGVRDLDAAVALLHPAVVWRDEDLPERAFGRDAVRAMWAANAWSRSVWRVSVQKRAVHALVLERGATASSDRLVSWLVQIDGGLVRSCWVSVLGRGAALGRSRESS